MSQIIGFTFSPNIAQNIVLASYSTMFFTFHLTFCFPSCILTLLAVTFVVCYIFFAKSLDPDQDQTNLCPNLDTICLYLLLSFHIRKSRVRRQPVTPKNDLKVTESTIVCSKHFSPNRSNYINFSSKKRVLKDDVVPTFFG